MKKNKMSFETNFWIARGIENSFDVIAAFIDYGYIDYYKQMLSEIMLYNYKEAVYKKEYPGEVFILYTAFRSFLRACSSLQHKSKRWKAKDAPAKCSSVLHQASLTKEEYKNPFMVFRNAFATRSLNDFELFLCEIIHLALSPDLPEVNSDLMTPYIHVVKMLDAIQLLRERGVEKIKRVDIL